MWRRGPSCWMVAGLAVIVTVGACTARGEDTSSSLPDKGAATAVEAVSGLVGVLDTGDFSSVSPLAMPDQPALASLAEGATFGQVAEALREDDSAVAANFWGGFAQGTADFLTGSVAVTEGEVVTQDGMEFHVVEVRPESGGNREIITREADGYRIDLFASFAAGLAERLLGPVERLLAAQTQDSRLILTELRDVVPSLLVAAGRPDQPPDVVQSVLSLVELITRVG